ncbi:hypothetical protein [Shimia sp.]|uniref:hypothetical protein n=1 Tax=Shimia sp. TaxID=1954381 RepID=UPI003BABA879
MSEMDRPTGRSVADLTARAKQVSDIYAETFEIARDSAWYLAKLTEELGEMQSAYLASIGNQRGSGSGQCAKEALADEAADLFGFLMVFAQWQGIDLEAAFERKWGKYLSGAPGTQAAPDTSQPAV